eukprot:3308625-Pleurochrysis_carterae.AAC.1
MSGAYEAMFEMPPAFHKPLSAEEMEMLAAPSGDECGECELPTDMPCTSASAAFVSQHAHDVQAQPSSQLPPKLGRGKYIRRPGYGIRD